MRFKQTGFTIVELLIVIVVIGILAAITTVAYNGIQTRATNTSRYHDLKAWVGIFEIYKAQEGDYPSQAGNPTLCLGSGFPVGGGGVPRCRDYQSTGATSFLESDNTGLMTELRKVATTLPSGPRKAVNGTVGPYVLYGATTLQFSMVINGSVADCPVDAPSSYDDGAGRTICRMQLTR